MGLGTVVSLKDLTNPPVPVLLCAFTFQNGQQLLACTHPLNPTEGGIAFPGTALMPAGNYLALVSEQSLKALQQRSPEGIDRVASVKVTLANANQIVWSNFEQSPGPGFRGATLQMAIVMWQVGTSNFSSDSPVRFSGTCDMAVPVRGATYVQVTATNSHNTGTVMLPSTPIQPRCPHTFPTTALERLLGASDPSSVWYGCGYNPDQTAIIVFTGGGGSGASYTATVSGGAVTAITQVSGGSGYTHAPTATVYGSSANNPAVVTCTVSGGAVTATLVSGGSGYGVDPEDGGDIRRGNLNGASPYTSCPYLRSGGDGGCMARLGNSAGTTVAPDGDLMHDTTGRRTGRFAGVEWNPPTYYTFSRSYEQQKGLPSFAYLNQNVYSQYVPEVYGTQWITPPIANIIEDGNSVRFECILTKGYIGQSAAFNTPSGTIQQVVVNGEVVPMYSTSAVYPNDNWSIDPLFSWFWVTEGTRNGSACTLPGYMNNTYSALGDPYGGMAVIVIVIYRDLYSASNGVPSVQVLLGGRQLPVFSSPTAYAMEWTNSPPWCLLDVLTRANWKYSEIDVQSFINAASFCANSITYTNATGATASHAQFMAEFALVQRSSAAEVIAGLLRSFNGYLTWDDNGLLQLNINQTLADSQPAAITGSNYNTAISSVTYAGGAANGYVAYAFDESSVNLLQPGSTRQQFDIEGTPQSNLQTPNQIFIGFQDRDNQYQADSLGEIDPASVARGGGTSSAGQPGGAIVPQTLTVRGISSFDQAIRIANVYLGERQYGNEANDARGTRAFTIGTTVKAEHLRLGHLVYLSWQQLGISNQLFRVTSIAPGPNWETAKIGLAWHQDEWYTVAYGQSPAQYQNQLPGGRAPRPWQPNTEAPVSSLFGPTDYKFGISQSYAPTANGSIEALLTITGRLPVNSVSTVAPPLVQPQGTTASTGGNLNGGIAYQIVLCALDSSGGISAPSKPITVSVPSGTATNTIGTGPIYWQPGTTGYVIFAGGDTYHVTFQATASGAPSTLTLTSLPNFYAYAPPDKAFSRFLVQAKPEIHAGILGTTVAAVSTNTIVLSGATITNNLAGTDVSILASFQASDQKVLDFRISSNSGNTLTLATDPSPYVSVGDVCVVRTKANIVSSTTIGDANFVNAITNGGNGLATNGEVGNLVLIWAGPGIGQTRRIVSNTSTTLTLDTAWDPKATPTSASTFVVVGPTWVYSSETAPAISSIPDPASPSTVATINVTNYDGESLIVGVVTEDATGTLGTQFLMPMREIYLTGDAGTTPRPWSPGYVSPLSGDAIGGPATFGVQPVYSVDAQGHATANLEIKGYTPINDLDSAIGQPVPTVTVSATGGTIPAGTYVIGASARSAGSAPYANTDFAMIPVFVTTGSTSSVTVSVSLGAGDYDVDIYMATWEEYGDYTFHLQTTIAHGSTSATLTSFNISTPGGPDAYADHFGVVWLKEIHAGPWAEQVQAVTSTTISIASDGMTANQWAGYTLSLLAKEDSTIEIPVLNIPIASSTASSGGLFTLTVGPNSLGQTLPDLTTLLVIGDVVVIRHKATFTASSFSDPNIANPYYPSGATNVEAGHVAVVLSGADQGDVQTILNVGTDGSGHYTIFNLAGTWKVTPTTGDIVVICDSTQIPEWKSPAFTNPNGQLTGVVGTPAVKNLGDTPWLFTVRVESAGAEHAPDSLAPKREVYFTGSQGTRTITANATQRVTDGLVLCDTSAGNIVFSLLPAADIPNLQLWVQKITSDTNTVTIQAYTGDLLDGQPSLVLSSQWEKYLVKFNG